MEVDRDEQHYANGLRLCGWKRGATVLSMLLMCLSTTSRSYGDIPPIPKFDQLSGSIKSRAELVIDADAKHGGPSIEATSQGNARETSGYCEAIVDVEAFSGADGVLTIRGAPTPDLAAPQFDEIAPKHIQVPSGQTSRISFVVPLRHNATYFYWDVEGKKTHGAMHVWATAVRCGTMPFSLSTSS